MLGLTRLRLGSCRAKEYSNLGGCIPGEDLLDCGMISMSQIE